jgi:hypothetical protein
MINENTAISQNTVDLMKVEPNSDGVTNLTSYRDGNQLTGVKVEADTRIEEVEDPLTLKFPEVKAECEVGTCVLY